MKNYIRPFALGLALWGFCAHAYIEAVPRLIENMFEGRKLQPSLELSFHHTVRVSASDTVEVEEILFSDRGRVMSWFKMPGAGASLLASLDGRGYSVENGRAFPTRSRVFVRYFFNPSAADFRELLRAEKFIRLDQLLEFKPGSTFEGDPQTWDIKHNYIRRDDVFLTRLTAGPGIDDGVEVIGFQDPGSKRDVVFGKPMVIGNRDVAILRRLEWVDGNETYAWNFSVPFRSGVGGFLPKQMSFEVGGVERIHSELQTARPINERAAANLKSVAHQTSRGDINSLVESVLTLLLSFR